MRSFPPRSAAAALGCAAALVMALVAVGPAAAQGDFPNIPVWSFPGAWHAGVGGDTIEARPRTISLRWRRDPVAEARPDFGGYRIYRATTFGDTTTMVLLRRFSKQLGDSVFAWHFATIDASTPESERGPLSPFVATFVDPDSSGRFVKILRPPSDPCRPRCYDSVLVLIPPPGPHDGFRTWYSITYEALNTTEDYQELFSPGPFGERLDLPVGSGPRSVLVTDVNRDAAADLVVANATGGNVSVYLGAGDGSYGPPAVFGVGTGPNGLAVGDFDEDGRLDVAVANRGSNDVSVLLGDGAGSFGPRADFGVGSGPLALGVGDVNRDANDDLVVASSLEASCSVLLGLGDGTFTRGPDLVGAMASPTDVVLRDINADAVPDLLVGTFQGAEVWRGNGDGTFTRLLGLGGDPGAHSVAFVDLNQDTRVDILYGNAADGDLRIGVRDTTSIPTYIPLSAGQVGAGIAGLATADFDADGRPEVVVANPVEGRLAVVYLDGNLNPRRQLDLPMAGAPRAVRAGRLDADGLFDLVAADSSLGAVAVIPGPRNLNHKAANVSNDVWEPRTASADPDSHFFARAVEPTGGPTANLARVGVVPNPYRAVEAWNPGGGHEVHFVNLPSQAHIRIYSLAGDLVREIQHVDPVRDFERWDLKNQAGRDVSSGVYMYRVEAARFSFQNRFVVIR